MTVAAIAMLRHGLVEAGLPLDDIRIGDGIHGQRKVLTVRVADAGQLQTVVSTVDTYMPGAPVLEVGPREVRIAAVRVPPSVALHSLRTWHTSSPTGGHILTQWVPASRLARGQVVRWRDGWAAIVDIQRAPCKLLLRRYGKEEWVERYTEAGMEVRTDMRIDPEDVL